MVTWWTRNGEFSSQVDYGKTTALGLSQVPGRCRHSHPLPPRDPAGTGARHASIISRSSPARPRTTTAGSATSSRRPQVLVDYTIRIKPTNKAASGQSAHFYVDVANNESKPYHGLELRFYFTADATTAADLVAKGFDNQRFDVGGTAMPLNITYGAAKQVPGMPDQWYFPITLNDTLPCRVAARASSCRSIPAARTAGTTSPFPCSRTPGPSAPIAALPIPVAFEGVDLSKGSTGVYKGPDLVETVNGKTVIAYTGEPLYHRLLQRRARFRIRPGLPHRQAGRAAQGQPDPDLAGRHARVDRLDLRQETGNITLAGKASSNPDGRIDEIVVNGETLPEAEITRDAAGGVAFTHAVSLVEGTNVFDVIAWDTAHCAFESRKLIVNWRKGPPQPPPQAAKPVANPPGKAGRDSIVVALTSATPGAAIWYTLDGKSPVPGRRGFDPLHRRHHHPEPGHPEGHRGQGRFHPERGIGGELRRLSLQGRQPARARFSGTGTRTGMPIRSWCPWIPPWERPPGRYHGPDARGQTDLRTGRGRHPLSRVIPCGSIWPRTPSGSRTAWKS